MADIQYQGFKKALVEGLLDGTPDIRLMLCMSSFTGESEEDAVYLDDITTLDEFDGVGYQQIDCANVAFDYDSDDDEYQLIFDAGEFNAEDETVAAGSDDATYLVHYLYVDGGSGDIILASTDAGGLPFNAVGTAITYTPGATGTLYLGDA